MSAIKRQKVRRRNKRKRYKGAIKNIAIIRLWDNRCDPPKKITADDHKNYKPKKEKNKKSVFAIEDSMIKQLNVQNTERKL